MREIIETYIKGKELVISSLKDWVKDKNISLEERWEVFIKSDLGTKSKFIERFIGIDSDDYDQEGPIYLSKYEYISVEKLLDLAIEAEVIFENDIILFKEDVLNRFIAGFKFDW